MSSAPQSVLTSQILQEPEMKWSSNQNTNKIKLMPNMMSDGTKIQQNKPMPIFNSKIKEAFISGTQNLRESQLLRNNQKSTGLGFNNFVGNQLSQYSQSGVFQQSKHDENTKSGASNTMQHKSGKVSEVQTPLQSSQRQVLSQKTKMTTVYQQETNPTYNSQKKQLRLIENKPQQEFKADQMRENNAKQDQILNSQALIIMQNVSELKGKPQKIQGSHTHGNNSSDNSRTSNQMKLNIATSLIQKRPSAADNIKKKSGKSQTEAENSTITSFRNSTMTKADQRPGTANKRQQNNQINIGQGQRNRPYGMNLVNQSQNPTYSMYNSSANTSQQNISHPNKPIQGNKIEAKVSQNVPQNPSIMKQPVNQSDLVQQQKILEQIQAQLIKNSKKHIGKDQTTEELVKQLRSVLDTMVDKNGDLPKAYNSQIHLTQLINDLIQNNIGQQAQQVGRQSKALGQPMRAHSQIPQQQIAQDNLVLTSQIMLNQTALIQSLQGQISPENQIKINKPTFNLQINNNIQNVQPHGQAVTNIQGNAQSAPVQKEEVNPSQILAVVTAVAAAQQTKDSSNLASKQKRTSSEDNVTQQLQMKALREAGQQKQSQVQKPNQINESDDIKIQNGIKNRKALPSLAQSRANSRSKTRKSSINEQNPVNYPVAIKTTQVANNGTIKQGYQPQSCLKVPVPNNRKILTRKNSPIESNEPPQSPTKKQELKSPREKILVTQEQQVEEPDEIETLINLNESPLLEQENLIKYIKGHIEKHNELPPTTLEFYKFVKLIGKGAFGKVTLGIHKLTGKNVAIKTIEKSYMKDEFSKRKVFQEVYLLKKIKHSNVIRLLEVFESNKHLLMVMEYAGGGDLLKLIKKRGSLKESDSKFIFKQIVYGLAHIHCRSVIHRDIKLDNILLDCEKGVKICDFGVSKIIKKGQVIQEQCGTPAYLAPEIIIDKGYEGFFVDIWSLGVLLYAMLNGTVPFKAQTLEDLHKLILIGEFTFANQNLSEESKNLIKGLICLEPQKRLTIPQILVDPWLKETNDGESSSEEEVEDNKNSGQEGVKKDDAGGKSTDIDLKNIQGNVNYVNVDNLFYHENYKIKLSYTDYCCITEDFTSENIDEEALKVCENFGFPRQFMIKCLNRGDINHATACYFLLTTSS